jgi:hypothetical protein
MEPISNGVKMMISECRKLMDSVNPKLMLTRMALSLCLLLLIPCEALAAKCSDICTGISCPPSSYPATTSILFWWPSASGNRTLNVPSPRAERTYVSYSKLNNRRLTINGTGALVNEIFVGSPGTSDTFAGFGGANTYVIGASSLSAITGSPDATPAPIYTTIPGESDRVIIDSANPDYVHIKGSIQVGGPPHMISIAGDPLISSPPGGPPTTPRAFRGSGELAAPCTVSWNGASNRQPIPMLASITSSWPSFNDTVSKVSQWISRRCSMLIPDPFAKPSPFPGLASVAGMDVSPATADRIFLPPEEFTFNGRGLSEIEDLFILGIKDVRFASSKVVNRDELEKLLAQSAGLRGIPTDIAPLIYFQDEGLLVSSLNSEPLGTRENPGKPIVRLLDRSGRPLALTPDLREGINLAPNQTLFQAPFLAFEPTQTEDNFNIKAGRNLL